MNITTPVERQAKGAVPTYTPRDIFQPSARKTTRCTVPRASGCAAVWWDSRAAARARYSI